MFLSTSSLAFAFSCVFFVVCAAESSFPVLLEHLHTNLRGANESLADLQHGSSPAFQSLSNLDTNLAAVSSDIFTLSDFPEYPRSVFESLRDASKTIGVINEQFGSTLQSKAQLIKAGSESKEDLAVLSQLLRLFKEMVVNVMNPFMELMFVRIPKVSSFHPMMKFLIAGLSSLARQSVLDFVDREFTPILVEIQQNDRMGAEAQKIAAEVTEIIRKMVHH